MRAPLRSTVRVIALLKGLVIALLGPALVLGSFDLHGSDLPHGFFDAPSEVCPDARHPLAPTHLVASATVSIPSCATCLLQRKSNSGAVVLPALAPVPVLSDAT